MTTSNSTLVAYRRYAVTAIKDWSKSRKPSRFLREFAQRLPAGGRVLDYGCGIGIDLFWLKSQGFGVEGIDGVQAFINEARRRCGNVPLTCADFSDFKIAPKRYDGIWCNASLIHLPPTELKKCLLKLHAGLVPGGILGITLAWGRTKKITRNDWIPGRYLACYTMAEVVPYFKNWKVVAMKTVSDDGRKGRWIQICSTIISS